MSRVKRALKDSVFTLMFRTQKYALQLYQALHPEDTNVTEADCKIITLENVLMVGEYNDCGLLVRDKLLLLVEAQATFTVNVVVRILLYLAETYRRLIADNKLDLYGSKPVKIPRPELYVIYTGSKQDVPDTLRLSGLFEGESNLGLELEVKVYRKSGTKNILEQYVRFCKIADENRKKYGTAPAAIEATLRQCLEEGILVPFLTSHEKEVRDIMVTLFDEAKIQEIHDYNVAKDTRQEGIAEGMEMTLLTSLKALMENLGCTAEKAMDMLSIPAEQRAGLRPQL